MRNLEVAEIGQTAEKEVENWLITNGFINVLKINGQSGRTAIEANGTVENILVHIKTALDPNRPGKISEDEKNKLKLSSAKLGRKAYVAYVVIGEDNKVVGEISWERLS